MRQVLPKMSIAQVMQLNSGFDPMLMEIARVQTPERLMEIEMLAKRTMFASMGISRRMAFIPGLYQMKMGDERKGWTLLALDGAALAAGIGYRMNSNDWKDRYDRLPAGTVQSDFDFYFNEANDRRKKRQSLSVAGRCPLRLQLGGRAVDGQWGHELQEISATDDRSRARFRPRGQRHAAAVEPILS